MVAIVRDRYRSLAAGRLRYPVARRVSGAGVDRRLALLGLTTSAIVTVLRMGFDSSDALLRVRVRAGRNGIARARASGAAGRS